MRFSLIATTIFLTACSHNKPVTTIATSQLPSQPEAAAAATSPARLPVTHVNTQNLGVSEDLARACSIKLDDIAKAPKFDFDDFHLLPEDRSVLEQVATCVTSGALKGHRVSLTGRADSRGTEEYNLALGQRRAHTVSDYLERLGVPTAQLVSSTRGNLDARGADENAWRQDRRVDLKLEN